jgi:hypothetical protein
MLTMLSAMTPSLPPTVHLDETLVAAAAFKVESGLASNESGFAVEPHAHHGAIENEPHDRLVGQRAYVVRARSCLKKLATNEGLGAHRAAVLNATHWPIFGRSLQVAAPIPLTTD